MGQTKILTALLAIALIFAFSTPPVLAQAAPKALKGKIITNANPIDIPTSAKGFLKKMKKQDRKNFKRDQEGKWVIHFVAFFKRSVPVDQIGVVVLDEKKEPVALADVPGQKGQKTLASQIIIDSTEFPGKKHTLQIYYAKGKKPVVLASKVIVLKK